MTLRLTAGLLLLASFLSGLAREHGPVAEKDVVFRVELPLQTPRSRDPVLGGARDKVFFKLWIPGGLKTVRGAVCNPFSKDEDVGKHWQAACRHWRFAYLQTDFDAVKKEELALVPVALKELARKSGHPEVEHMPLCFTGMSRGGGMSMQLAERMPQRTIASVPVCLEVGPNSEASRQVPVLTVFGEKDGSQMDKLLRKLPVERKLDARWSIAVQWGRKHEFGQANNLVLPFFDSCIALRLPKDADPAKGPVELTELKEKDGWVGYWSGNPAKGTVRKFADAPKDVPSLGWFPDHRTAAVWQAFVEQKPELSIEEPAGLGDGKEFTTRPADKAFTVKAKTTHRRTFVRDGAIQIAASDDLKGDPKAVTVEKLSPGIHTLILHADDAGGAGFGPSRPVTVVVPRGK